MMLKTTDAFSRLQPRHVSRRERTPGARERHSAQRQRLLTEHDGSRQQGQNIHGQQTVATKVNKSSYSMDSAVTDFSRNYPRTHEIKPDVVISRYKELSTIDEIRANIKSTSRTKSAPPRHVPDWMLNLDINLDVTSVDIIPPFNEQDNRDVKQETYTESPSFAYVDNDTDVDEDDDWEENLNDRQFGCNVNQTGSIVDEKNTSGRNENASPVCDTRRIMSNTFKKAERFSPESYQLKHESPRRYQGDKRVMSLQQGGIRSTPMQPKSKKFINQMITYHHMKHHDRKLKKAKPAVDTKMPSTFKYALDRKQLVEQRLNQSWSRSEQTSTPSKSPTMSNKPHSTPRDSR